MSLDRAWLIHGQTGELHRALCAKAVKFNPCVFPGEILIRYVGSDLTGKEHKSLAAFDLKGLCDAVGIIRHQRAGSGNDVVE